MDTHNLISTGALSVLSTNQTSHSVDPDTMPPSPPSTDPTNSAVTQAGGTIDADKVSLTGEGKDEDEDVVTEVGDEEEAESASGGTTPDTSTDQDVSLMTILEKIEALENIRDQAQDDFRQIWHDHKRAIQLAMTVGSQRPLQYRDFVDWKQISGHQLYQEACQMMKRLKTGASLDANERTELEELQGRLATFEDERFGHEAYYGTLGDMP